MKAILSVAASLCWLSSCVAASAARPNVLFIAVDDLWPELRCYGAQHIVSPKIDKLAESGVRFTHAYCQVAVCGATRTSLLTGLRPDTTGVYANRINVRKSMPEVITLPQYFKQNGYYVEGMGKIFHHRDLQSWSVPDGWPKTEHLTWRRPENAKLVAEKLAAYRKLASEYKAKGKRAPESLRRTGTRGPAVESADVPDNAYFDGELCDMALEALGRVAKSDKPFFLAVGFLKPHLPFVCPQRYWDLYDPASIRLAENPFAPAGAPACALHSWGELRTYHGIPKSGPVSDDMARRLIHGYYACVSYTDALVGRVLDELESLELNEKTIVILWGDHGWHLGDHGLWCKHSNFETATHVPLIVRVPGMKTAGRSSAALVEFIDIYPTLAELAGLPVPSCLEGASFAPLLDDPERPWKTAAFSQYPRAGKMGCSMRTHRYRFTRWVEKNDPDHCAAVELYDHQSDPQENTNIAADGANAELVRQLTAQMSRGWRGALPK